MWPCANQGSPATCEAPQVGPSCSLCSPMASAAPPPSPTSNLRWKRACLTPGTASSLTCHCSTSRRLLASLWGISKGDSCRTCTQSTPPHPRPNVPLVSLSGIKRGVWPSRAGLQLIRINRTGLQLLPMLEPGSVILLLEQFPKGVGQAQPYHTSKLRAPRLAPTVQRCRQGPGLAMQNGWHFLVLPRTEAPGGVGLRFGTYSL